MARNYQITKEDDVAAGGAKTKAKRNIAAIRLLKEIEETPRAATRKEQETLVLYTGWGAAPDIFTTKESWAKLQGELRELLSDGEFESARSSILNAHYTEPVVIAEIYAGLNKLGFRGGRILDPSMGASGMFEGVMPKAMAESSDITGIELDSISGRIAAQLYPESTVHVGGFQDIELPDDYFDLTISNVPFSEVGVADPNYKGSPDRTLHDYFFAKGLDKVRPGGLLAYVTSTGTMQSARGERFREHLAAQANLVGAIRLPGDAFKQIAGTEVTTDLIILQKLGEGIEPNGENWSKLQPTSVVDTEGNALKTNEYFVNNPQMMLGTLADDKLHPGRLAMRSDGRAIGEAIREAFEYLPEGIYNSLPYFEAEEERTLIPPELQKSVKHNAFTLHEGKLMVREGSWLKPAELTGKKLERAIGLIAVRDATENVLNVQLENGSDPEIASAQETLNRVYDRFVETNGAIHRQANKTVFKNDPSYPLLLALENYDRESQTATKTDIFNKRTIQPYIAKDSAETAQEALLYSLNEFGQVDIGHIANLVGSSQIEVSTELQEAGLIFREPAGTQWKTQDEYLSGNVRRKLAEAIAAAQKDSQFSGNVEALEAVQPAPIPPGDIDVRLGATWIPTDDLEAFVGELLETTKDKISIRHSRETNTWYVNAQSSVSYSATNTEIHGSGRKSALDLIEIALNLKTPIIYDYDEDGSRTLNVEETAAAKLKFETIRERFKDWLWIDSERTDRLTNLYNDKFNTHVERQFNGDHLELPGMNPQVTLRPHQKNAVWQALNGNTMFAHAVGAGKTFSMIAAAMEQKRLGLAQKPMLVVPNHLLEQIATDCKHLYPASNVLAATKKDSSKKNRQQLMSRIATGDWDIVLVTHSAFEKLRMSDQAQTDFYQEAVDEIEEAIQGTDGYNGNSRRVMKDLERRKESLKNKIQAIADSPAKDNTVTFEQLGVDCVVVDESHYFKNLGFTTKMRDVAGLPNTNSNRAFDMYMKTRYISQIRGEGKGLIFATGTPITNSVAELYTVQRYLQPEVLEEAGISGFDEWASTFGDTVTTPELSTTGEFKVKTRFARFVNLPELMTLARQVMDVQTQDMLNLPIPEIAGGKPTVVAVPATDEQLYYMAELVERAKNLSGVDPSEDNPLKIATDGRKMSATPKLIDPDIPVDPDSKLSRLVDDTVAYWQEHKGEKTHLIFSDLGTPKTAGRFSIYKYIKQQCIERGVPAEKIAFAQDANSDAQKLALQKDFNSGKVAILIAGASLETGFNGQRRLGRISHFTVPWRPDQIEQRDGRGLRQGNRNKEVEIFRYTTQGRNGQIGFDGYLWQTLGTKQKFVDQAMKGSTALRRMDDISNNVLSYSELEGISTGNPLIMEKATVDNTVAQLSMQKRAHTNSLYRKRQALSSLPQYIRSVESVLADLTSDLETAQAAIKTGKVTLWNAEVNLNNAEEIGKSIRSRAAVINKSDNTVAERIGKLGELSLYIQNSGRSTELVIKGNRNYRTDGIVQSKQGAYEALTGIESVLQKSIARNSTALERSNKDLESLSKEGDKPFAKEEELQTALKRQAEIYAALDSIGKEPAATTKISAAENQPNTLTQRIARFLEHADLHTEITSAEGFKATLKEVDTQIPVTIDAREGTSVTIQSEVPPSTLGTGKNITLTFSISNEGILEEVKTLGVEQEQSHADDSVQLGHYLARNVFSLDVQAPDKSIEVESTNTQNPAAEDPQTVDEKAEPENTTETATPSQETETVTEETQTEDESVETEDHTDSAASSRNIAEPEETTDGNIELEDGAVADNSFENEVLIEGDAEPEIATATAIPLPIQPTISGSTEEPHSDSGVAVASSSSHPDEPTIPKPLPAAAEAITGPPGSTEEKVDTSEQSDKIRPGFRRYLEGKTEYLEAIVIVRTPIGFFETYGDDAKTSANELGTRLGTVSSGSNQHGRVAVNRIFPEKLDHAIETLRQMAPVAVIENSAEITLHPQLETVTSVDTAVADDAVSTTANQEIQPAFAQGKTLERIVATFLHEADLPEIVMLGNLHMTVENQDLPPLRLDTHDIEGRRSLAIEQHQHGSEETNPVSRLMSFSISDEGVLNLQSTAFRSPTATSDARDIEGCDRTFATAFARTLAAQKFSQATRSQLQSDGPESGRNMDEAATLVEPASPTSEEPAVQLVLASQLIPAIIEKHDPELASVIAETKPAVEVKVEQLREWYRAARDRQQEPAVLENIKAKGITAKENGAVMLSQKEADTMRTDLEWLAEHPAEPQPVSIETLREWYRANTVVAGANYKHEIEALAAPLREEGTAQIMLSRSDYQRMSSDVKALRSTIASQTLEIWQMPEIQARVVQTQAGQSYMGKEYDILQSSDRGTLTLTNKETKDRFVIKADRVEINTLAISDIEKISAAVTVETQAERHKEIQR